jgi:hypothetical protein
MIAAAVLVPILLGLSVVRVGLGALAPSIGIGLGLALAIGIGLGLDSAIQFACMVGGYPAATLPLESIIIATLLATRRRHVEPVARAKSLQGGSLFAACALASAATAAAVTFVRLTAETPVGWWDAWAYWNLRARFLVRLGSRWPEAFTAAAAHGYGHIDYPLLLPVAIARFWTALGSESERVPQLIATAFAAVTLALVVTAIARQRDSTLAAASGLALLALPEFILVATYQYADEPLAFFLTAAIVLLRLGDETPARGPIALAGLAASLAAWTKNEGLAALAALVIAQAIAVGHAERSRFWRPFLLGAAPVLALLAFFKLRYAPPTDLIAGQGLSTAARIADLRRYGTIALGIWEWMTVHWVVLAALGIAVVFLKVHVDAAERAGVRRVAVFLASLGAAYLAVFVTTPLDVVYHVRTALPRLMLHLWPIAVLLTFSALRPLEAPIPLRGPVEVQASRRR